MASRYSQTPSPYELRNNNMYSSSPETDINILLLGQTGTGKTTFLNSFVNYLAYNTLEEALNGKLKVLIPCKFTVMNKDNFEDDEVFVGDRHAANGEFVETGLSATKSCRSYLFNVRNRCIRLIDVPGVGDTQNIDQDVINLDHTLSYLGQYEYVNGICIFLKTGETRRTIYLSYCIREVLRQLHTNARENIMFVFTHSRATNFEPGDTTTIVRNLLNNPKKLINVKVPFNRDNCFLFDNESFRFVAVCQQGITHLLPQKDEFSTSWSRSVNEIYRMIEYILKCGRHAVQETRSLAEARQLMTQLARPIAEAVKLIEENRLLAENYKLKILEGISHEHDGSIPQCTVRVVELEKRLTVCIDSKCTRLVTVNGERKVDYHKHCHDGCHLNNVVQECIGHPILKGCTAMTEEGNSIIAAK